MSSGGAPASETEVGRYLLVREGPLDWAGLGQVALRSTLDKELHWQSLKSRPAPSRVCLGKKFRISRKGSVGGHWFPSARQDGVFDVLLAGSFS